MLLPLLFLATSTFAAAPSVAPHCFPAKEITAILLMHGFIPVAELEIGGLPGIIWANPVTTQYEVMALKNDTLCSVSSGEAFHLIKMRNS